MPNPKWELPFDKYGKPNPFMRARGLAIASKIIDIASSTWFEIDELTTLVQVTAVAKDMFLKWSTSGTDYAKGDDYDEYIPAGTTIEIMVPLKSNGNFYTSFQVAGVATGGKVAVVEK